MENTYIPVPPITTAEMLKREGEEIRRRIEIGPYGNIYRKIKMLEEEFEHLTFEQAVELVRLQEIVQLNDSMKEIKNTLKKML